MNLFVPDYKGDSALIAAVSDRMDGKRPTIVPKEWRRLLEFESGSSAVAYSFDFRKYFFHMLMFDVELNFLGGAPYGISHSDILNLNRTGFQPDPYGVKKKKL